MKEVGRVGVDVVAWLAGVLWARCGLVGVLAGHDVHMSYDLAVWEGVRPSSDDEAAAEYERLMDQMDEDPDVPPSPSIVTFTNELLARWPALGEPGDEASPWATGPEIGDAAGPITYITMTYSGAQEGVPFAAEVATRLGLVCFDPQEEVLR